MVNQNGDKVVEDYLTAGELEALVFKLLEHLKLDAWRTNATKHGNVELQLWSSK